MQLIHQQTLQEVLLAEEVLEVLLEPGLENQGLLMKRKARRNWWKYRNIGGRTGMLTLERARFPDDVCGTKRGSLTV